MMTLEKLFKDLEFLVNISQLGWLTTPTNDSSSQLFELGMEWMVDQDGS